MVGSFSEGAVERAGSTDTVTRHVDRISAVLEPGETVLEIAETTAPGRLTAVFATDRRLLMPDHETIHSVRYDSITQFYGVRGEGEESTLKFGILHCQYAWVGFSTRGLRRILHAYQSTRRPHEHSFASFYNTWRSIRTATEGNEAEFAHQLNAQLADAKWW